MVQILLEVSGIDVDFADKYGRTALKMASRNGNEEIVELIKTYQERGNLDATHSIRIKQE